MGLTEDVLSGIEDGPAEDIRVGIKYTCARVGGRIGVAHTLYTPGHCKTLAGAGELAGTKVARLALSEDPVEAVIGTAAINAQLSPSLAASNENIFKRILEMAPEFRKIGVVGEFPFVKKLDPVRTFAFEKREVPGYLPVEKEEELIPECDLVIITGCAFSNHTLENLLRISNGYTMVIGPTTPLSPVLFKYGAHLLAGIRTHDKKIMDIIGQGGGTRNFIAFCENIIWERNV